ncbi:DOMON domain-containing protein [Ditylenchus destructor]|uniref:DOMON domain-containing protein n=1 Tax=Ditylenchus destructor TaxID=166010 RepID=A0AAD4NE95_9BILA|nr:DOMON domain-containing protein [Ditylenchus destructor]
MALRSVCTVISIIGTLSHISSHLVLAQSTTAASTDFATPLVRLIKPEARSAEQNSSITRVPEAACPTPKRQLDVTSLFHSNDVIEVFWFNPDQTSIAAPKIELLTSATEGSSHIIAKLDPADSSQPNYSPDRVASKFYIIPQNLECKECVLRLTLEMGDGTSQMVSCAEVQIANGLSQNTSSLHQSPEVIVDCTANEECSRGQCVQGSCYCPIGYFGQSSPLSSVITTPEYNAFTFPQSQSQLLWRIDSANDTIELALRVKMQETTEPQWYALGIRPNENAWEKCSRLSPKLPGSSGTDNISQSSKAQGVPLDKFGTENSIDTLPSHEKGLSNSGLNIRKLNESSASTDGCGPNEIFSTCPEHSRTCEASCDWTAFPESIPSCPKACGKPRCVCKEGHVRLSGDKDECKPFDYCQAAEVVKECPRNETLAKCGTSCEPSCENMYNTEPCEASCQAPGCTCIDNYVRLNGRCVYWGHCPNLEERFLFNTGSVPPRMIAETSSTNGPNVTTPATNSATTLSKLSTASSWETITAPSVTQVPTVQCPKNETYNECGHICEADCVTVFVREECKECGTPGCACTRGFARSNGTCVYWGDCPLTPELQTQSSKKNHTAIKTTESVPAEGTGSGVSSTPSASTTELTTLAPSPAKERTDWCMGSWSWPTDCRNSSDCDYKISWTYSPETDVIDFFIESKLPQNWWTGVGFSATGSMHDVDMIVVKSQHGGVLSLHDMHVEEYGALREDEKNNVMSEGKFGSHSNGILHARFSRKRSTDDDFADYTFTDEKCYKFLFPVSGGRLLENGTISNPLAEPHVSSEEICIRACPKQLVKKPDYSCQTEYKYPEGCEAENCDYHARWHYNAQAKDVTFEISSKGIGRWTGIGFSRDGNMSSSDVYTGWVYDGKPYVTDRFAYGRQLPAIEPNDRQNIYNISGKVADDIQTIVFTRKVVTTDKVTDFPLDKCYHFLYPVGGGRVLARKSQDFKNAKTPIGYHDKIHPESSVLKICICDKEGVPIGSAPPRVRARRNAADSSRDQLECADITLVDTLGGSERLIRIVDGFAQSGRITVAHNDETLGGKNSLMDVSTNKSEENIITVLFKKSLKENDFADFSFGSGLTHVYLAYGKGPFDLSKADSTEFTNIDFLNSAQTSTQFSSTIPPTTPAPEADEEDTSPFSVNPDMHMGMSETTVMNEITTLQNVPSVTQVEHQMTPATINAPVLDDNCYGQFDYPQGCSTMCAYSVLWRTSPQNSVIEFSLSATLNPESWTGIGFSPDGHMANADAIIVSLLKDSSITVIDQYSAGYSQPRIDKMQDIFNVTSAFSDGRLVANFSRSFSTGDMEDDVDLSQCQYFLFMQSGGQLEPSTSEIRRHTETPITSNSKICPANCALSAQAEIPLTSDATIKTTAEIGTTTESTTTTTTSESPTKTPKRIEVEEKKPKGDDVLFAGGQSDLLQVPTAKPSNNHLYDVVMRVVNEKWRTDFENVQSEKSLSMVDKIKTILTPLITAKWKTLKNINIIKFYEGSVISQLQIEFEGDEAQPSADELREFLKQIAAQGQAGDLSIDMDSLTVQENKHMDLEDKWGPLKDLRNWAIMGVSILFLVSIVVLLFLCSFRSRRRTHPKSMSFSPHQAYQYASYPGMTSTAFDTMKGADVSKASTMNKMSNGKAGQRGGYGGGNSSNSSGSPKGGNNAKSPPPAGIGEATYQEWYTKVASKETPSHFQESTYQTPPARRAIAATPMQSYVTYPNDPTAYYTLNGEHRLSANPPPSYYRHH